MANELVSAADAPADQSKLVASFASSTEWTLTSALTKAEGVNVPAVIAGYERGLRPLKVTEPNGVTSSGKPGRFTTQIGDALALLLTKIMPTISAEQSDAWTKTMCAALADLPGRVTLEAAEAALHRPIRFANEVDPLIRELAEGINARHATALVRLKAMQAEIARASEPALPAPAGYEDGQTPRLSPEEIRRTPAHILRIGLKLGDITQDEIDAAMADQDDQEAKAA